MGATIHDLHFGLTHLRSIFKTMQVQGNTSQDRSCDGKGYQENDGEETSRSSQPGLQRDVCEAKGVDEGDSDEQRCREAHRLTVTSCR